MLFSLSLFLSSLRTISSSRLLTVFVWGERSCVDVDVRIDLDRRYGYAACVEQRAERAGDNSFANAADHTTGDEYVLHAAAFFSTTYSFGSVNQLACLSVHTAGWDDGVVSLCVSKQLKEEKNMHVNVRTIWESG